MKVEKKSELIGRGDFYRRPVIACQMEDYACAVLLGGCVTAGA